MRDAAGAWRAVARAAPPIPKLARCVQAWGPAARGSGAPAAVLGALLEAAIGGDADATGALCALVEAEPPLPPSDAVAPYHTLVALAVAPTDAAAAADARLARGRAPDAAGGARRGADGARLARRREPARGPRPGRRRHAAQRRINLHGRDGWFPRRAAGPVGVRCCRGAACLAVGPSCAPPRRRARWTQRASGQSFEDRDDATFNRLYHAGPCLYQLALALGRDGRDRHTCRERVQMLEDRRSAVLGEEEEEDFPERS